MWYSYLLQCVVAVMLTGCRLVSQEWKDGQVGKGIAGALHLLKQHQPYS